MYTNKNEGMKTFIMFNGKEVGASMSNQIHGFNPRSAKEAPDIRPSISATDEPSK